MIRADVDARSSISDAGFGNDRMEDSMKIVRTKGICGGQPRISGTRLTVSHVLLSLASHRGISTLLRNYPGLTMDGVLLVLIYAAKRIESEK
jgi:uncharacterized protein (DUF433 family)